VGKGAPGDFRWPTFGQLVVLILVTAIGVNVATGAYQEAESTPEPAPDLSVEAWVGEMYEDSLKRKQRRQEVAGTIGVTRVECARGRRRNRTIPCLAHVAATGDARELAPADVTIRIHFQHPDSFSWEALPREP
jgi:hypothetical protein